MQNNLSKYASLYYEDKDCKLQEVDFTEANLENLRVAGCEHQFKSVEEGVRLYMEWLNR